MSRIYPVALVGTNSNTMSIPAHELHLGNIVIAFKGYWTIDPTDFRVVNPDDGTLPYEPVPLTEELLLKSPVFIRDGDYVRAGLMKWSDATGLTLEYGLRGSAPVVRPYDNIKYLHQLQNLYFWDRKLQSFPINL